jgi:toxin ParE1/3/4
MKVSPVILRAQADRDIQEAVAFYLGEGAEAAALAFVAALERALSHVGRFPSSGSQRYGHELGLSALRSWPVARYPHLVFYVQAEDRVEVWRVLHGQRDLPAWLRPPEGT